MLALFTAAEWEALKNATEGFSYEIINYSHNNINNLTRFPSLSTVKTLDLSHNDIQAIEPLAFHDLDGLEILDLSNNRIDSTALKQEVFEGKYDPTLYEPLKNLKVLKLGNNLLHNLDSVIFQHLSALEELYLNDNPFQKINTNTEIALSKIGKLRVRLLPIYKAPNIFS